MEYVIPGAAAIHKIAITDMSAVKWVIAVINNPAAPVLVWMHLLSLHQHLGEMKPFPPFQILPEMLLVFICQSGLKLMACRVNCPRSARIRAIK